MNNTIPGPSTKERPKFEITDLTFNLHDLKETTLLKDSGWPDDVISWLSHYYSQYSFSKRALATIINACLTQRRLVFTTAKSSLWPTIAEDPNNDRVKSKQISGTKYKEVIALIGESGFFEILVESTTSKNGSLDGTAYAIELVYPPAVALICELLGASKKAILVEQKREVFKFVKHYSNNLKKLIEVTKDMVRSREERVAKHKKANRKDLVSAANKVFDDAVHSILTDFFIASSCNRDKYSEEIEILCEEVDDDMLFETVNQHCEHEVPMLIERHQLKNNP